MPEAAVDVADTKTTPKGKLSRHRDRKAMAQFLDDTGSEPGSVAALVARLRERYPGRITGDLVLAPEEGRYAGLPDGLDPRIAKALRARGINALYHHQAQAWEHVQQGRNVVVVTPTASGKTLCYNLPVIQGRTGARRQGALLVSHQSVIAGPGR